MKLLANLFIFVAMALICVGMAQRFLNMPIIFVTINPLSHIVLANTFLLIALILKLAND